MNFSENIHKKAVDLSLHIIYLSKVCIGETSRFSVIRPLVNSKKLKGYLTIRLNLLETNIVVLFLIIRKYFFTLFNIIPELNDIRTVTELLF